ncbi:hypothetical protein IFM47457_01473 [Aspergillus lentulus]|nr:hypothetical protein IFM47457_01473 [Aspergillus lentulus]
MTPTPARLALQVLISNPDENPMSAIRQEGFCDRQTVFQDQPDDRQPQVARMTVSPPAMWEARQDGERLARTSLRAEELLRFAARRYSCSLQLYSYTRKA